MEKIMTGLHTYLVNQSTITALGHRLGVGSATINGRQKKERDIPKIYYREILAYLEDLEFINKGLRTTITSRLQKSLKMSCNSGKNK